jgi:DNA-binding protein Fis
MECAYCKTDNRENANFCRGCGRQIELKCSHCQNSIPPDSRFCDNCGTNIRPVGDANFDLAAKEAAMVEWIREVLSTRSSSNLFEFCTDKFTGILIKESLKMTNGNKSQAAELLGISRPTFHSKLEKHLIDCKL